MLTFFRHYSLFFRFYYDCLMKPNAKSVTTAIRKVVQGC